MYTIHKPTPAAAVYCHCSINTIKQIIRPNISNTSRSAASIIRPLLIILSGDNWSGVKSGSPGPIFACEIYGPPLTCEKWFAQTKACSGTSRRVAVLDLISPSPINLIAPSPSPSPCSNLALPSYRKAQEPHNLLTMQCQKYGLGRITLYYHAKFLHLVELSFSEMQ